MNAGVGIASGSFKWAAGVLELGRSHAIFPGTLTGTESEVELCVLRYPRVMPVSQTAA